MKKVSLCFVLLILFASMAMAQGFLTTLFASNGGYRGNMFDITPRVDMTIPSIDVNCSNVGGPVNVNVWYYKGTCVGNDMSSKGWILLDSSIGVGAGMDLPTNIPLPNGSKTNFKKGQVYGIYVDFVNYPYEGLCRYSNGNLTVSNADLVITTYYGKGTPAFTGPTFSPRIWNGTIYYDKPVPLSADVSFIPSVTGGTINFSLDAGSANGNRNYALIGGVSGTSGWNLPGGLNVPVTWDVITSYLLNIGWGIGKLDVNGQSAETLTIPSIPQTADVTMSFAYFLEGLPNWDFVSNGVNVVIKRNKFTDYGFDDGTIEDAMGLNNGGDICWMDLWDAGPGDSITSVSSAFGNPNNPGFCPPAGSPVTIAVWDDPNDDINPSDGVLITKITGVLANVDTNIFNYYQFPIPVQVTGVFCVGCVVNHPAGHSPAPMDTTPPTSPFAWVIGDSSSFDYKNLMNNDFPPISLNANGTPANWLLRVQR